jgi:hypothetical protein
MPNGLGPSDEHVIADLGDGLEFWSDGFVRIGGRLARNADVPLRDDLKPGHRMLNKRVLKAVIAGMPNSTVANDGRIVPVNNDGDMISATL